MKIRSLFYHIKDGLKNIYRNRLFSLASIATIAACIFLFGILYSLVMNFQYMVKKAENEVCVTVFFDEGLSETQIKQLGDTISKRVEVSSVHYTSASAIYLIVSSYFVSISLSYDEIFVTYLARFNISPILSDVRIKAR